VANRIAVVRELRQRLRAEQVLEAQPEVLLVPVQEEGATGQARNDHAATRGEHSLRLGIRSHNVVIRAYNAVSSVTEAHEQAGNFKKPKRIPITALQPWEGVLASFFA
jgi:hypothetical protein